MAEHVRIFCREDPPPTIKDLLVFFSEEGFDVRPDEEEEEDDESFEAANPSWNETNLLLNSEPEPIVMECWRDDEGDEFAEMRDELLELAEEIDTGDAGRVIKHMKSATFVITLPVLEDFGDDGRTLTDALITYLATNHDGMAYVEGEGVYANDELILEVV